ncbi:hypothetical protein HMPREF1863_00415 [Aedoeadaptatus coxii]|uniref:Uncharacterized protein n=1 Tax=Aedoeadaptatus coxii TaxID=755172 RepID=A0A134AJJ2_9FIRM|nr:hypothetical protein HMPREF1863_00415 [Peptoniphilus coxii]
MNMFFLNSFRSFHLEKAKHSFKKSFSQNLGGGNRVSGFVSFSAKGKFIIF